MVFISNFTQKLTKSFYGKIDRPEIVINNSVPLDLFKSDGSNKRLDLKIKDNEFVIIVSAAWRRHKRLEEIIKFFLIIEKKMNNLRLLVLGETELKKKYYNKKIIFSGYINHKKLSEWYRTGNLYMHLSWIDQNANTHVEATACGLPSICSNNGGNKEIIELCNSGIVSKVDKKYNYELIDFYNPPEPDYKILEKDFKIIYNNYKKFRSNINFEPISINQAAKKYLIFMQEISKLK